MPTSLPARLAPPPGIADWVRDVAGHQDPRVGPTTPVVPLVTRGLPTRPVAPEHSQVFICAGVIVKIHGENTDRRAAGAAGCSASAAPTWTGSGSSR